MHVQGISHWAPANIGTYSQSTKVTNCYKISFCFILKILFTAKMTNTCKFTKTS